jgi:ABC-type lipoprotein release transport system permease subunit
MKKTIQKQRYLIDYALSSLLRRKGKNLSLLVIYSLIVFFLASVLLFTTALKKEVKQILIHAPEITLQRQVAGRHALMPADYLTKLGRLRGVTEKRFRLWGYYYDKGIRANYTVMATGDGLASKVGFLSENGAASEDKTVEPGEIIIGASLAKERSLTKGFFYNLYGARGELFSFTIKDIIHPDSDLMSADLLLMNASDFRQFFSIPDNMYTDLVLHVANPREVINVAGKISTRLPDVRPILREEILRTYDAVFDFRQGIVMVIFTGSILAFFILAWEKASGLSGEEKREISVLKAIGWETVDIIQLKFWEGMVISLTAFLIGYLIAFVHVFKTTAMLFEPVLKGWAVLYPAFNLTPTVDGLQISTLMFFSVFPYILATIIPVWRAAVIDPAEGIR